MPRVVWPLFNARPAIQVVLQATHQLVDRNLLADTGAGTALQPCQLLLHENDCRLCGGRQTASTRLGRAYTGVFPVFVLRVHIPQLAFDDHVQVVGVRSCPPGFDGLACFSFLRRFTYGNFGHPDQFGLEL